MYLEIVVTYLLFGTVRLKHSSTPLLLRLQKSMPTKYPKYQTWKFFITFKMFTITNTMNKSNFP